MAYIVARPHSTWEIRESRATPAGPRGRTLATFRVLTDDVVAHAGARSSQKLQARELRAAAVRAGAPVAAPRPNQAAGELLAELAQGAEPRPVLRKLLLDAIAPGMAEPVSDSARSAMRWIGVSPGDRGETLRDLLLLSDRLPGIAGRPGRAFPRISSAPTAALAA
ncbi:MAG: hypothetical protein ACRDJX_05990 [Solirubrobacteraceae bacterium]